jgi:hypothetical protein
VFPETYHDLIKDLAHIEVATVIADVALEWSGRTPPLE